MLWILAKVTTRFMESLHFLNTIFSKLAQIFSELNFFYFFYIFYIYALKSLNLVLILDARFNDRRPTWTGCFNIFLSDFFLIMNWIWQLCRWYDADNTIEKTSKNLFKWFSGIEMRGNSRKCHLILSTDETTEIQMGESLIKSNGEKLLSLKIDFKLTFNKHINKVCKSASYKLRLLIKKEF